MDPALQLQRIYQSGFEIEMFERFPRAVGVVRDNCIALLEATPDGLRIIGAPGWRMGEVMGVLVQQGCHSATPERLETLRRFREDLEHLLNATA
jgi:hypothetical protein